ncbi:hypothetical protein Tco_0227950 [Tanacetum coccineum]
MFYQNRPFHPPYNNQNAFYQSPNGLYRPTMDSSTSSQANQPYYPLNRVTLDMDFDRLIYSQEYYVTQDYSMGHGSAPIDDDSHVQEMSPIKAKNPSKRASNAKKNDTKEKEPPKDWTTAEEIALGEKKSKTSETTSGSTYGGFNLNNEADEFEEEAQEHRSMGRDHSKAKKKSSASSRGGSSSFVDLVVDR